LNAIVASSPRLLDRVRSNLRAKHYSIRTEEAYIDWRVKLEPSIRSNVGLYAAKRQWRTPALALAPAHHPGGDDNVIKCAITTVRFVAGCLFDHHIVDDIAVAIVVSSSGNVTADVAASCSASNATVSVGLNVRR